MITKTIGELIDELSIINCKIFYLIDLVQNDKHTREDAKKIQDLNKQRSLLKSAINAHYNEPEEIKV